MSPLFPVMQQMYEDCMKKSKDINAIRKYVLF